MSRHIHIHVGTRDGLASSLVGTAVKAAKKLNEVHGTAYRESGSDAEFEEGKHPRGEGGKFSSKESSRNKKSQAKEAWADFYKVAHESDYPNFSHLLGSAWGAGSNINQTPSKYRGAAYRRMLLKYGDEPE